MDIQNKILDIVYSYSYKEQVSELVNKYERSAKPEEGEIIYISSGIDDRFIGDTEDEIVNKVSEQIIRYRIKEKAVIKLMSKGEIHPVSIGSGYEDKRITCTYGGTTSEMSISFRKSIFTQFIKV